ncbi:MAG: WD40 repeat domain-containing protein [Alphaproteobacteria bacterium]|nr:WD40 repeat domain-containing protein [Alphaproteobacteria bacterium]
MADAATTDSPLSGAERTAWRFDAFVTAIAVDAGSNTAAFALGSGRIRLVDFARQQAHAARTAEAHAGAALALIADAETGFVSGGDDGRVVRVAGDGASFELANYKGQWVEHLCLAGGRVAAAVGRTVHWLDGPGGAARTLGPHASTVSGLAWSAGRLIVAHYNGISAWGDGDEPERFEWKGAHLAIAASPDQRFVGTATQDNSLHVWRLENKTEMRMAGYPAKIASLSWSCDSLWLAGSGVNGLMAWPFDGDGPEGREPRTFLDGKEALVTRVAFHPRTLLVAGGFNDGMLAVVDIERRRAIKIPVSKGVAISALAWSQDGRHLAAGAEDGRAAIVSLPNMGATP